MREAREGEKGVREDSVFCLLGGRLRVLHAGRLAAEGGKGGIGGVIMTVGALKALYRKNNPYGLWFTQKSMRLFGDTMRNFTVRDAGCIKVMDGGEIIEVDAWELYRRRPVNGGLHGHCGYFRKSDGRHVGFGVPWHKST